MNIIFLLGMLNSLSNKQIINYKDINYKNINCKDINCKDCIFYTKIETGKENKIKPMELCRKYGEKDSFTGKIIFYEAEKCREDVFRCGEYAKHFIKKEETQ
jgi:hypothetical protein